MKKRHNFKKIAEKYKVEINILRSIYGSFKCAGLNRVVALQKAIKVLELHKTLTKKPSIHVEVCGIKFFKANKIWRHDRNYYRITVLENGTIVTSAGMGQWNRVPFEFSYFRRMDYRFIDEDERYFILDGQFKSVHASFLNQIIKNQNQLTEDLIKNLLMVRGRAEDSILESDTLQDRLNSPLIQEFKDAIESFIINNHNAFKFDIEDEDIWGITLIELYKKYVITPKIKARQLLKDTIKKYGWEQSFDGAYIKKNNGNQVKITQKGHASVNRRNVCIINKVTHKMPLDDVIATKIMLISSSYRNEISTLAPFKNVLDELFGGDNSES